MKEVLDTIGLPQKIMAVEYTYLNFICGMVTAYGFIQTD